jgi:hypothetical protein
VIDNHIKGYLLRVNRQAAPTAGGLPARLNPLHKGLLTDLLLQAGMQFAVTNTMDNEIRSIRQDFDGPTDPE